MTSTEADIIAMIYNLVDAMQTSNEEAQMAALHETKWHIRDTYDASVWAGGVK